MPGVLVLTAALASAQTPGAHGLWDALTPADPGRSDLSPLGVEARLVPIDTRLDWDFETLYRGRGADGQTWFARRNAGVTAIFPRSVYAPSEVGQVPMIPPDTTFVIGEPNEYTLDRLGLLPAPAPAFHRDASGGLRLDSRLSLRRSDLMSPVQAGPGPGPGRGRGHSHEHDSPRRGVGALLRLAAERERLGL